MFPKQNLIFVIMMHHDDDAKNDDDTEFNFWHDDDVLIKLN